MSRHVSQLVLRQRYPLYSTSRVPAASFSRFHLPVDEGARSSISNSSRQLSQLRFGGTRRFGTFQDAAAKNPKLHGAGPAAVGAQLGLRKTITGRAQPSQHLRNLISPHTSRSISQRRLFSDKKPPEEHRSSLKPEDRITPSETSKQAHEHASNKGLLDRLPHLHRPTKEELLGAATGFWQKLGIHFKWISIRSFRPYTLDEIGAFISWIFLGHVVWIIVGTTTFVSLAIWAVNTVFAQETLAGWVGNYLTKSSGIRIVFESAIVPTWRSGVITFNNVFVSRRPGQQSNKKRSVSKGSSTSAAAAASVAMAERSKEVQVSTSTSDPEDDSNYTQFDVTINTVNVTLSFSKWFNGKGLLHDVEILGVRGVIDRSNVQKSTYYIDPKTYRHEHSTGDFEIDSFKMTDVLLSIYQPDDFRPFTVSVFNCELPRLRKQWLFYDLMSANNMSGSFDDSLFTVHPRQVHGHTGAPLTTAGNEPDDAHWKKHSRLRIDGLKIDHLNRGVEGPFGWIHEGNVDIVADVMIPTDEDGVWRQSWKKSTEAMSEFYDRIESSVTSQAQIYGSGRSHAPPDTVPTLEVQAKPEHEGRSSSEDSKFVLLDMRVHLNDVRASIPLLTHDLSYINNALVRPIVAYINSRRAFIPVTCRVVKRQSEFDGSWTIFDSGLMDDLSREVYDAFARDVSDEERRGKRMRLVGRWVVELVVEALFLGLAGQIV